MKRGAWIGGALLLTVTTWGCGGSQTADSEPATESAVAASATPVVSDGKDPKQVITDFLEAVRTGNSEPAAAMLSVTARKKTAEMDLEVAPQGSASASFEVGECEMLEGNGAHVHCLWANTVDGETHTDEIIWVLRNDPEGWRIVGMITQVFEDMDPIALDFEDPANMQAQQATVEAEIAKRTEQAPEEGAPPRQAKNSEAERAPAQR
jgi:hypothetical protein